MRFFVLQWWTLQNAVFRGETAVSQAKVDVAEAVGQRVRLPYALRYVNLFALCGRAISSRARTWNGIGSASVIKHVGSDGMEAATVLSHAKRACQKQHVPQSWPLFRPFDRGNALSASRAND